MKRFKIKNQFSGLEFEVVGESLEAIYPPLNESDERELVDRLPPEWGENPEIVITDIAEEIERTRKNRAALSYLAETDWYVVRFSETGEEIPADVKAARQEARDAIVR